MSSSSQALRVGAPHVSSWPVRLLTRGRDTVRGTPRSVLFGGTLFALICVGVALAPWIVPHDPAEQILGSRLGSPTAQHWLGTDHLGRDVFSRLLYGGRYSITIAAIAVAICGIFGTVVGALSARIGGLLDEFLMRTCDVLFSFPDVLIALVLVAVLHPSFLTLILAMTVGGWTPFARLSRGLTLEINTKDYIEAAEALGCSRAFIIFRHVIPNTLGPVLAMGLLRFSDKLLAVGSLSYLGLGVQPPDSDWGSMLADAQPYMERVPTLLLAPGIAIFLTAFLVTIAGQGLSQTGARRVQVDPIEMQSEPKGLLSAPGDAR